MANSMFVELSGFLEHVIVPLATTPSRSAGLFREFQDAGYLALQENIGLTVIPRFAQGLYTVFDEGAANATSGLQLAVLSHPSLSDDDFTSVVEILRDWTGSISPAIATATSRKIRLLKNVENGVPLTVLQAGLPDGLLLSYRRPGDFAAVIDTPMRRRILATKNIG